MQRSFATHEYSFASKTSKRRATTMP